MLYKIFWQRSKWILLFAGLAIIASFYLQATDVVKDWHQSNEHYHSKEFNQCFKETPEIFLSDFKKGSTKEDFIRYNLTLHLADDDLYFRNKNDLAHADLLYYYHSTSSMSLWFKILCFLILGFVTFFVDLKTRFNQYLFTLNVKKSRLFSQKVLFFSGFILAATLLGCILAQIILYTSIPNEYLNATFIQAIYSIFSTTLTYFTLYIIGLVLGAVLGHMILGPISIVLTFYYLLFMIPLLPGKVNYYLSTLQFIPSFYGLHPYLLVLLILAIVCGLLLAYYSFKHTSLEENGSYILAPKLRLPIFLLMSVGTSLLLIYGYIREQILVGDFHEIFLYLLFIWGISIFLVYHQTIIKKWRISRENRT